MWIGFAELAWHLNTYVYVHYSANILIYCTILHFYFYRIHKVYIMHKYTLKLIYRLSCVPDFEEIYKWETVLQKYCHSDCIIISYTLLFCYFILPQIFVWRFKRFLLMVYMYIRELLKKFPNCLCKKKKLLS